MSRALATLALVLSASVALAAEPQLLLQHQGRLLGADDTPVNGPVELTLSLYAAKDSEEPAWTQAYAVTAVNGLYAIAIGDTSGGKRALTSPDVAGDRWLGVKVSGRELLPRLRVGVVPVAILAKDAERLGGVLAADYALKAELAAYALKTDLSTDAATLDGHPATDFVLAADGRAPDATKLDGRPASDYLLATATAADAAKLGGRAPAEYLLATAEAADAAKLDGRPASDYALATATAPDAAKLGGIAAADYALASHLHDERYVRLGQPITLPSTRPASPAAGTLAFNTAAKAVEFWDGAAWQPLAAGALGTSCADVLAKGLSRGDGIYRIQPKATGPQVEVYCDMTTEGGGWTLVSYGHRASSGGTAVYLAPTGFSGTWNAATRDGIASIDATELVRRSTHAALATTTGGAPTTGNLKAYQTSHMWAIQNPASLNWDLSDNSSCVSVSVKDLKTSTTFTALQQLNRMQVSCSGHKGGTSYERTFIGFNSTTCYGACGADPVTSMGMVVWRGDGYCPTTSGGQGCPERAGSFALWLK